MKMIPTAEQKTIFKFVKDRSENILIEAFAGAGKTTTIVEAVKLLPSSLAITFLAFNKHIKEELSLKLPEHVKCYTTYGLGYSAIMRKYKGKIKFDELKIDKIIQKKAKSWSYSDNIKNESDKYVYFGQIKRLVDACRLTLTLKPEYVPYISDRYDIGLNKPEDIKRALKVLDTATNDRTTFDYTDMVYLPAVDNSIWMFPQDVVFVDEVQDVNRCQIRIIEKILKKDKVTGKTVGRLIAVGDYFQGIYGFNYSDDKSFQWFRDYKNTETLKLSYSFRCAKNVILKANEIVPDIKALENAPDGVVREGSILKEAESGDFVLCRTTAPLIRLFFELLVQHKKAVIKGTDIGLGLIEMIKDHKTIDKMIYYWETKLFMMKKDLAATQMLNPEKHSGYVALEDKVLTLSFLGRLSQDVLDLKAKISMIFSDDNGDGIILSTIHKAKGSEANRVFIARPDLMPLPCSRGWQMAQEKNLEYVAITRAKHELIFDHEWTDEKMED
jgi:DNA helicase-2/ATP-dependent DNA helicase PcrA